MENRLIFFSAITILIYLSVQVIFLRMIHFTQRASWQKNIALSFSMICFFISLIDNVFILKNDIVTTLQTVFMSNGIINLFILVYLFSIFSFLESSITLKIFLLIKKNGTTRKDISTHYNATTILNRRLQRLQYSNNIIIKKNTITLVHQRGSFIMREKFYSIIHWLFPKT